MPFVGGRKRFGKSHSSLGRAVSVDVSSGEHLEFEGSRKGWFLRFLVENFPSEKRLSVENHSGSAEDRF